MISGSVLKIPKYALGNWQSRHYGYTDVFTVTPYGGGRFVDTYRYFKQMPVFAKAGGAFVTSEDTIISHFVCYNRTYNYI